MAGKGKGGQRMLAAFSLIEMTGKCAGHGWMGQQSGATASASRVLR